jgi:hypothetical protein
MTGERTSDNPTSQSSTLGDRYRLIRPIGSGGMAVVWEARDEVLNRTVAVKVLAGRHLGDPQARDLIRQEARAAASLSHPNIAQVHDYGETATTSGIFPYVVMELVRGDTLQTRASRSPVTPRFAMQVCAEVAAALAAAHAEGIVHRDVKPANVMLAPTGAKVVDFGIAAAVAPGRDDDEFEVLGTPAYLAPERLISDVVEPASDVYALAILLYELLAGALPWSTETTTQMLSAHIYVDPEPLRPTDGVPGYVVDLCNRCLAKDPTLRPSAREVAAVLAHGARLPVVTGDRATDEAATGTVVLPTDVQPTDQAPTDPARSTPPASAPLAATPAAAAPLAATPAAGGPAAAAPGAGRAPALGRENPAPSATNADDPAPAARRPFPVRRWAVAGAAAVLLLVVWVLWPHSGRSAGHPAAGAETVSSQPAAPGAGAGASPSVTPSPRATRPAPGRPVVTRFSTATPSPAARTTVPATGGPTRTTEPTTAPSATGDPAVHKLISTGGKVKANCPGPSTAQILTAKPIKPFKLLSVDTAPGPAPAAVFKQGKNRITMTITCQDGEPSTVNTVTG